MARVWSRCLFLMMVLALAGLFPSPVFGAEGHDEGGKTDLFGQAIDLGIWTLVVFALLLVILRRYAWGPMLEGLQKREHDIEAAIEEAKRTREDAERLRLQLKEQMDKAHDTVRGIVDEARRDAQHLKDEMVTTARAEIQAERERLRHEIETARDQALQELWNQTAQLATLVSSKVIRRQLTPDDHRRLVDEALAEISEAGNDRKQVTGARA